MNIHTNSACFTRKAVSDEGIPHRSHCTNVRQNSWKMNYRNHNTIDNAQRMLYLPKTSDLISIFYCDLDFKNFPIIIEMHIEPMFHSIQYNHEYCLTASAKAASCTLFITFNAITRANKAAN